MASEPRPTNTPAENQLDAWLALTGQVSTPAQPVVLPMLSGSMAPSIPIGAQLQILVQPRRSCRAGEVAVFLAGEKLTAHRILWACQIVPWPWLLEKGDANPKGQWRHRDEIRGRVLSFVVDNKAQVNPTDTTLASQGLRSHLRHWLKSLGGLRPTNLKPNGK